MRQPAFYIPHGGGPCFFMDDPDGVWTGMEAFLRGIGPSLPERPRAILIVSGHWETQGAFAFTGHSRPELIYDYYNFPPHTYALRYDAPGDPALAEEAAGLLRGAGFHAEVDPDRGLDHGVFVPLKVAFPEADIPVVEMSLDHSLDPALHLAAGRALAPLRDKGVLILGAGMSFHNLRMFRRADSKAPSEAFDRWLVESVVTDADTRADRLTHWEDAPAARLSHPREEHLLPLMVAAGAAGGSGEQVYGEHVMDALLSGFRFD